MQIKTYHKEFHDVDFVQVTVHANMKRKKNDIYEAVGNMAADGMSDHVQGLFLIFVSVMVVYSYIFRSVF